MSERKNLFLIGRRPGDEDQLTEMLAYLWQEQPVSLNGWLAGIGVSTAPNVEMETQFRLPSGKRPDIAIRSDDGLTLVESKLGAGFGDDQVAEYLRYLGEQPGRHTLVLLTQRPEVPPQRDQELARTLCVRLVSERWQSVARHLASSEDPTLAGDFVRLLVREGLVKPDPIQASDLNALNAGYNVGRHLEVLLSELDPHIAQLLPGARGRSGGSTFWSWRAWSTGTIDVGVGFLAAEWTDRPKTNPVVHVWVLNRSADDGAALRAVGVSDSDRWRWTESTELRGSYGLNQFGPAVARPAHEVLAGDTFDEQLASAVSFVRETYDFYVGRGYLPNRP